MILSFLLCLLKFCCKRYSFFPFIYFIHLYWHGPLSKFEINRNIYHLHYFKNLKILLFFFSKNVKDILRSPYWWRTDARASCCHAVNWFLPWFLSSIHPPVPFRLTWLLCKNGEITWRRSWRLRSWVKNEGWKILHMAESRWRKEEMYWMNIPF